MVLGPTTKKGHVLVQTTYLSIALTIFTLGYGILPADLISVLQWEVTALRMNAHPKKSSRKTPRAFLTFASKTSSMLILAAEKLK